MRIKVLFVVELWIMSNQGSCNKCNTLNEYTEQFCTMCGERLPWAQKPTSNAPAPQPATPATKPHFITQMPTLGIIFLVGGICAALYFFILFDVSVAVPSMSFMGSEIGGGRVNNIGLMAQRQNGILISIAVAMLGGFLVFMSRSGKQ